ncbi:MAG: 30S ribosomal protein S13 [Nanoarchaeota archaeon]|nr:30S ribosomal protein S13 [Nanoarchaeota archaeon]
MRISGVNIPDEKKLKIALTYIYGIGRVSAEAILKTANVNGEKPTRELTSEEVGKLQSVFEKSYKIEGELRQIRKSGIQRLKSIKSYRGRRHERGLPTRGQRTKTNSRTVRGNVRKTAGSGKRKVDLK